MGREFSISKLISRAKDRADMEDSGFITDSKWRSYLSSGYAELYSILVSSGARYFEETHEISADGSLEYDLPGDHLSTVGVDRVDSQERHSLTEAMAQERKRLNREGGEATHYAIVGDKIQLQPAPRSGDYELIYVPHPTDLSDANDSDEVDVVTPDGEQFLVWYAAVIALAKEESDARLAIRERERARERLEEWATLRALHAPRRRVVEDSPPFFEGDYRGGSWPW